MIKGKQNPEVNEAIKPSKKTIKALEMGFSWTNQR